MSATASQITSLTIVFSIVNSGADQRKHQSSASLAFVRGIHRWPVNSPHKGPVRRKIFPFDDVIMNLNHGKFKSSHKLQNRCQFWQHMSSQVKFGIIYYHYYHICFYTPQCNHRYGLIVYGWGKITYSCHLYFMNKFVLYISFPVPIASHIVFVSVGQ